MVIIRPRDCKLFVKVCYYRVTESRTMKPVQATAAGTDPCLGKMLQTDL